MQLHRTRPDLLRAERSDPSRARQLRRLHAAGRVIRLRAGVYLDKQVWDALDTSDKHLAMAWAVAPDLGPTSAFSHVTAALIHGWPLIGPAPERIHVVDWELVGVEHRVGLIRHGIDPAGLCLGPRRFDGVPVVDALGTAMAVARTCDPAVAAVAIDHAVRMKAIDRKGFEEHLPPPASRGGRRARLVATALDPAHESPGESYSSIRLVQLGVTNIHPQHEFFTNGFCDRVDFWLPDAGVVVEFDGKQKYVDRGMLAGRDPGEVLWQEKRREDRIRTRREVRSVIRVTWWHLESLDRFRALLRSHGVLITP
jgi:hypothetical protein